MTRIGILSDSHLHSSNTTFKQQVDKAFAECSIIIHAGDLTDVSILKAFTGKQIHAVAGNMCNRLTQQSLPEHICTMIAGYLFCICHGANGPRETIEDRMFNRFAEADCIIYGHTHRPACHRIGTTLMMNPGCFQSSSRYGFSGNYGIITIDEQGLNGTIHSLSSPF